MKTQKLALDGRHTCDGCEKTWSASKLEDISDLTERIEPGGIVPSGECPECGALCYPKAKKAKKAKKTEPIVVTISGGAVQDVENPLKIPLEIRDYDVEAVDARESKDCHKDKDGDWYQKMTW
jgi:hypothetical protein